MSSLTIVQKYLSFIDQCIATKNLLLSRLLHSHLLKTSLLSHTVLANRLLHLYSLLSPSSSFSTLLFDDIPLKNLHSYNILLSSLPLADALHLFDRMPQRNIVSFNTLLSSLTRHGHHRQVLCLFSTLLLPDESLRLELDRFTVATIATACAGTGELGCLKQLHGFVLRNGLLVMTESDNLVMCNVFVDGYSKCEDVEYARKVFDGMEAIRDVVSWTSLVSGYARGGRMRDASRLFDKMPARNAASWTALISGYEQNGEEEKAVEVFEEMTVENSVWPSPSTLVSVLSSLARLGLVGRGKQVHGYLVRRTDSLVNLFTCNALIDMYSKCGDMASASTMFGTMPGPRDFISWNSMVTGFAQNGLATQSLTFFERMIDAGVSPTHVTFLGVISACSHAGLVSEGRWFLNSMEEQYGVCPRSEHYAAFVDMLGRNRQLEEAVELVESLPWMSNAGSIWGALLGACQVHGNVELGRRAAERLFALEPDNGVRYVALANIYAAAGKWDEAKGIRVVMKRKRLRKDLGQSWIEVRSVKSVFGAADKSHCESERIYDMLHALVDQMTGENQISSDINLMQWDLWRG